MTVVEQNFTNKCNEKKEKEEQKRKEACKNFAFTMFSKAKTKKKIFLKNNNI